MAIKYKVIQNPYNSDDYTIRRISDFASIPRSVGNVDYQQFITDVLGIGTTCVEGPTVGVTTAYDIARAAEYPPLEEQLDKIYHSGVDAWKADIKAIKDKYPKTQVGVTTVAAVPSWVQTDVDERRKTNYLAAVERLKEPRLKLGTPYIERVWNGAYERYDESIKYQDIPDPNGLTVVTDEADRDAAQAVIDGTPQSIIDSINT